MLDRQDSEIPPLTVVTSGTMPLVYYDDISPTIVALDYDLCLLTTSLPPPPPPPPPMMETPVLLSPTSLSSHSTYVHQGMNTMNMMNNKKATDAVSPRKRPRHRVSFNDAAMEIYEIPNCKYHYTKEEFEDIYLTRSDYKRIQKENMTTYQLMLKDNIYPSNHELYFRGLEVQLPQAKFERQMRTKRATNAILKQQRMFKEMMRTGAFSTDSAGVFCGIPSHWIDTFYVDKYSAQSSEDAWMAALFDHATLTMNVDEESGGGGGYSNNDNAAGSFDGEMMDSNDMMDYDDDMEEEVEGSACVVSA